MKAPIFIGGAGRSGTTLLRVMLDSHPNICAPNEFKLLGDIAALYMKSVKTYQGPMAAWGLDKADIQYVYRSTIMTLFNRAQQKSGKQRIAEKSPQNVHSFWRLHDLFPESPLIQVIRDGRDVCSSLIGMNVKNPETGEIMAYTTNAKDAADYWRQSVESGRWGLRHIGQSYAQRYYEVRYEDLINNTEETLRKLLAFCGEPWDDRVLKYYETKRDFRGEASADQANKKIYKDSIGRFKNNLTKEEMNVIIAQAGDLLKKLNYL